MKYFDTPFTINDHIYHYELESHEIYRYKNGQIDFKWWHPNLVSDEYADNLVSTDILELRTYYA